MRWIVRALCVLGLAVAARQAFAEDFPTSGPRTLAERADLVVEAHWEGGDSVRIVRTRVASRRLAEGVTTISVAGLGAMGRVAPVPGAPFTGRGAGGAATASKDLVIFADFDARAGAWRAIDTLDGGAQGVWWIDGPRVLHYEQYTKSGSYALTGWRLADGRAGTRADLDAAVTAGIAGRDLLGRGATEWFQRGGVTRLLEYAALPCSDRRDALHVASVAAHHLRRGENVAVAAWQVTEAIESARDAGVRSRLLAVLTQFGEDAQPVAHRLEPLLGPSAKGLRADVLRALAALRSPGARDAVRAVLADGTPEEAFAAVSTLEAISDTEVGARLAKRLAGEPAPDARASDATWLAAMLRHQLTRLDPPSAAAVAKRWMDDARFDAGDRAEFGRLAVR